MSRRSWIVGGVIFLVWGVMTWLLIRVQAGNEEMPFAGLAPSLVVRQMFQHGVSSDLGIYDGIRRIGSVTVEAVNGPPARVVFFGNLTGTGAEGETPLNFEMELRVRPAEMQALGGMLRLRRRQPELFAELEVSMEQKSMTYEIRTPGMNLPRQKMPLGTDGLATLGFMPSALPLPVGQMESLARTMRISAHRGVVTVRGERTEVFRLRLTAGEETLTAVVGQLGEVFAVRGLGGYSLRADGMDPASP